MMDLVNDTFAEAFGMRYARVVVTAIDEEWLQTAAREFCGYGTSVIHCDAEVGIEEFVNASETPDGRKGVAILAFAFNEEALASAIQKRTGQCLMTCPTTAVFNGLETDKTIPLGEHLRYFGDGFQKSKVLGDRRFWRIPVMDGEFIVEESVGVAKGVAGGNFVIQTNQQIDGLVAAQKSVEAIAGVPGCVTPFPGGIARSGSKVGSKYKNLKASTADNYCPTLRGRTDTLLHPDANCAYEIVIDGVDEATVRQAMRIGIEAALSSPHGDQVLAIGAGNYGGKLGKYLLQLRELFDE